VAIGETGLDFFREGAPAIDQERAFRAQIELARELDKPVVIHTRAAEEQTLRILEDHAAGVRVMLHCFTLADHLDRCLEHGDWWFSFAGNSTYPANAPLRAAARRVPPDRLLVETDAPYLSPQPLRGKPNQPAHVVHTAQVLAAERGMSLAALEQSVHRSAAALFGW
jgi:TatD DNase family protein